MKSVFSRDTSILMHIVLFIVSTLLLLSTHKLPMLGTIGLEAGNLFVTVCGPLFLAAAALGTSGFSNYRYVLAKELKWFLAHLIFYVVLLYINGLFLTSCSAGSGLMPFLLIAIPPLLLNIAIGSLLRTFRWPQWIKVLVITIAYLSYYAWIFFSWWQEGTFRVLSHASLLLTSDLLQGDRLSTGMVGFRASTLLLVLAVVLIGIGFFNHKSSDLFNHRNIAIAPSLCVLLVALTLAAHWALQWQSMDLIGKRRMHLIKDYQLAASKDGINIYADPTVTSADDAKNILDEALFYQHKIKRQISEISSSPITIWLHRSDREKFSYTGAKHVHFALPKHREIHISGHGSVHSVLGHELAHIYLASGASNVFGLLGKNYLIPNMALSEGLAVLVTQELNIENGLSIFEQARAMFQAGVPIDFAKLFNSPLGFAMVHPDAAYIYAGAAIEFFLTRFDQPHRKNKVHELILVGQLSALFDNTKSDEENFNDLKKSLSEPVPPYAIAWAEQRFTKDSILTSHCDKAALDNEKEFKKSLINADVNDILASLTSMPSAMRTAPFFTATDYLLDQKQPEQALSLFKKSQALFPVVFSPKNAERLAFKKVSILVALKKWPEAYSVLSSIDKKTLSPASERLVQASSIFLREEISHKNTSCLPRSAMQLLFSRSDEREGRVADFAHCLGKYAGPLTTTDVELNTMGRYLLARIFMHNERDEEALGLTMSVLSKRELLPPSIEKEALNMLATTNRAMANHRSAISIIDHLRRFENTAGEELYFDDQIERINFIQRD